MERAIRATDAVRSFSEILNRVKFQGSRYIIIRGGKPVASICPVEEPQKQHKLAELKTILKKISRLGDEAASFEADIHNIIKHGPSLPKEMPWD